MKSLREVYTELGVGRTTVQYWVDKILCRPKQWRGDNTSIQFSDEEVEQIWTIRFYKELGYSNEEIRRLMNDPDFDADATLERHIVELKKKRDRIEMLLRVTDNLKSAGITPREVNYGLFNYEECVDLMQTNFELIGEESFSKEKEALFDGAVDRLYYCFEDEIPYTDESVQECIPLIRKACSSIAFDSLLMLEEVFSSNAVVVGLNKDYKNGFGEYLSSAVSLWCRSSDDVGFDKTLSSVLVRLESLKNQGAPFYSEECIAEAERLYKAISSSDCKPCDSDIEAFELFIKRISRRATVNALDRALSSEGLMIYIIGALECYKDKIKGD